MIIIIIAFRFTFNFAFNPLDLYTCKYKNNNNTCIDNYNKNSSLYHNRL